MPNIVVKVSPATLRMTGLNYMTYANRYCAAAQHLESVNSNGDFDPVIYHLYCLSLELHLKSFIWLRDGLTHSAIKKKYDHKIRKLWADAKLRGIVRFAAATTLRDRVIRLVGPFYEKRRFVYLDLAMIFRGFAKLRDNPRAIGTLRRLDIQLSSSLHQKILDAT
jgi:hypothetical protein